MSYYNWLQRVFVQFNDSLVTTARSLFKFYEYKNMNIIRKKFIRLTRMMRCKQDCNFRELLTRNFTDNGAAFAKIVMSFLPPTAIPECKITLKEYLPDYSKTTFNGSSLLDAAAGGLPLSAIATPLQLAQLKPAEVLSVLQGINNSALDDRSRRALGANIPPNSTASLSQLSAIISAVPTDLIKNAPVADIVNNLASLTQNALDPQLKAVIASKVFLRLIKKILCEN